ncbi:28S ribosomal protein S18b, mitochondrial [Eublepharis macularius]|uniref:Small ribosomal subunit protein mS40 n=1 Tax=Eublepharis macularius TaxID=481883 RepID=A0AA97J576_EUBMA|nr:28S ribosomal protein S18b, mitochondrial [Eublepharis macularius]
MAAASGSMLLRNIMGHLVVRAVLRRPFWVQNTPSTSLLQPKQLPFRIFSTEAGQDGSAEPAAFDSESRFKEKPWEYLESEEYIERYGSNPVWFGYRRNHKGQIPPQKTRKTCIRREHICGNPCPICRDQNLFLDYRNVKLLEQFICPYTGITYHPTRTGICMKKYKQLTEAIQQAQDNGLLFFHSPFISFQYQDYSNQHPAVTTTPPSPALQNKTAWYDWYDWQQPSEKDIALIRRIYKDYLKEESSPP